MNEQKRLAARIDRAARAAGVSRRRYQPRRWTVTSNKEYLDNLAATDPQALQAWFDAPRGGLDAPRADYEQVDGNDVDSSTSCETCDYKRANERQARKIENVCAINAELQEQVDTLKSESSELQAELEKQTTNYANVIAAQIKQMNELAHNLAESERLREEMREELSIAYDHAHDLLARRDRGLA